MESFLVGSYITRSLDLSKKGHGHSSDEPYMPESNPWRQQTNNDISIDSSGKGRCEGLLTMNMKAEPIEPPIATAKIVMRTFLGTSMWASGLSGASPLGTSGSLSASPVGRAMC